jgi:hypothetical protein
MRCCDRQGPYLLSGAGRPVLAIVRLGWLHPQPSSPMKLCVYVRYTWPSLSQEPGQSGLCPPTFPCLSSLSLAIPQPRDTNKRDHLILIHTTSSTICRLWWPCVVYGCRVPAGTCSICSAWPLQSGNGISGTLAASQLCLIDGMEGTTRAPTSTENPWKRRVFSGGPCGNRWCLPSAEVVVTGQLQHHSPSTPPCCLMSVRSLES